MKKHILLLHYLGLLVLAGFYGTTLYGQTGNPGINIQGILRDATGKTLDDGQYSVSFRLYTVRTGGMPVWQETADVDVSGGIFSHNLGSVTPLNAGDFSTTLYLGVKTNNFELTPRTELTYAPYTVPHPPYPARGRKPHGSVLFESGNFLSFTLLTPQGDGNVHSIIR